MKELSPVLLERLMHYYYFIVEQEAADHNHTFTSTQIARMIHIDDTLVRKDLATIGVRGHPRVGFRSAEALSVIQNVLGFNEMHQAALIGVGHLGSALAAYKGFSRYGLEICALFDSDLAKSGQIMGGIEIQPMSRLPYIIEERNISIAILTVPAEVAQRVADVAVNAGIKSIWNFAGAKLDLPDQVVVRHEHLSVGLAVLIYQLERCKEPID